MDGVTVIHSVPPICTALSAIVRRTLPGPLVLLGQSRLVVQRHFRWQANRFKSFHFVADPIQDEQNPEILSREMQSCAFMHVITPLIHASGWLNIHLDSISRKVLAV